MMLTLLESALIKGFDGLISLDAQAGMTGRGILLRYCSARRPTLMILTDGGSNSRFRVGTEARVHYGGTGTGKTKLIEALIRQDILAGALRPY